MAEKETKNNPKNLVEAVPKEIEKLDKEDAKEDQAAKKLEPVETEKTEKSEPTEAEKAAETTRGIQRLSREEMLKKKQEEDLKSWVPKTKLGLEVKAGKIKDIDQVLAQDKRILESEVVDTLLKLETDLILIGQAKGKFGGGKRRAWRQTQKKTQEGNVLSFSTMAIVGDKEGHIGLASGKAKETLPAREKALRKAKLNLIKIKLGYESPEKPGEKEHEPHTIPFKVIGKCGSVSITLRPAPRGTGLVVGDECKKILNLAGIKDVYSKTQGQTKTTFNLAKACFDALRKTTKMEGFE
tara:strand:- start:3072 stop:3962 length:891 start_codon:yes stop_codon:yes gene_type:complete